MDATLHIDPFSGLLDDLTPKRPEVYVPMSLTPFDPLPRRSVDEDLQSLPDSVFPWSVKFCMDLALGLDSDEVVCLRHNVSETDYERFKLIPAFRRDLSMAAKAIREEGLPFKMKCRVLAEDYLLDVADHLSDDKISVSQRFEMFLKLAKLGGLEPKEEKTAADNFAGLPRIAIKINL